MPALKVKSDWNFNGDTYAENKSNSEKYLEKARELLRLKRSIATYLTKWQNFKKNCEFVQYQGRWRKPGRQIRTYWMQNSRYFAVYRYDDFLCILEAELATWVISPQDTLLIISNAAKQMKSDI